MEIPYNAEKKSFKFDAELGKEYYWCACGLTKNEPFCDGSHKGTVFRPVKWVADEAGLTSFCLCRKTMDAPRCDNFHKRSSYLDEPIDWENS